MSSKSFNAPRRYPGDSPAMSATVDWLETHLSRTQWRRPQRIHIKVGTLNFYPGTGSLRPDFGKETINVTLEEFTELVLKHLGRTQFDPPAQPTPPKSPPKAPPESDDDDPPW